jgi:nitrite reductase/ring-hydroxylating ferredoxin subunit
LGKFIEAGRTGEFNEGMKKKVLVGGQEILLARVGDKFYAVGNRCPHLGGELAAGQLEGTIVTCPLHGSQFDITDGRNVRWLKGSGFVSAVSKAFKSSRTLPVYNVRIDGETILIEV